MIGKLQLFKLKKKIGITQRVENYPSILERRDCLDQRWTSMCNILGCIIIPLVNCCDDIDKYLSALDLDMIIISGGNDLGCLDDSTNVALERDYFENQIIRFCIYNNITLLGVCRGLQILNIYFGGSVTPVPGHVATNHLVVKDGEYYSFWPQKFEVNSYHKYGVYITDLAGDLLSLAKCVDGTVEAFKHKKHNIFGIMWHPERESELNSRDKQMFELLLESGR